MDITKFNEKFNRVDGKIYVVEEVITPVDGAYEAELIHDNVELKTINVYTGPKLTGTKITTYSTSTPSLTPWKTVIKIFSNLDKLYITYETTGDQVEAEDINNLQDAINLTQEELNKETNRATSRENNIEKNLNSEITRAKNAESTENTRAINRENLIEKNLDLEVERAKASEKVLTDNLNTEINRAKGAEKAISDNLLSETNRATNVESTITNNLNKEIDRAKAKENSVEDNINNYKTTNNAEIQGLKAKDIDLDNKKANLDYVNLELNKRYTKDQTFTRDEVLKKIQDLIGTAPDTLDTFKEIADALGNDPNFATTIMNELSSKVDKVTGKSLSTNDYDNTEKSKLADVNAKKHEHSNKNVIDKITQGLLDAWNNAYSHISDSIRHITSSERNLWNTVSDKANKTEIPSKLSQLTNDKKFITQDDIDTSQNHIHNNKSVLDKISQKTLDDINLSADKVLKNESTPIKTDSTLTKLDNCAGGYVRNMQIRGRTLQNVKLSTGYFEKTFPTTTNLTFYNFFLQKSEMLAKPDTTYTVVVDFESVINEGQIQFGRTADSLDNNYFTTSETIPVNSIGRKIFKLTTKNDFANTKVAMRNFVNVGTDNTTAKGTLKFRYMILEGDWTGKEIPEYFEGIKSVGEAEGNKISILSHGKNLFDINDKFTLRGSGDGTTEQVIIYDYFSYLEKGKNYTFSCKTDGVWGFNGSDTVEAYLLKDKKTDNLIQIRTNPYTFTCNVTGKYYLRLDINKNNTTHSFWDIQIEEGTIATTYEEYKEDKTEILLTSPHAGLPSGVADIVNFDKSERIKNVDKAIFDGSDDEKWTISNNAPNQTITITFTLMLPNSVNAWKPFDNMLSDKFTNKNTWDVDEEGISISTGNNLNIRIAKSKLSTPDVAGFKKWLQTNPTTVYYQLAEPKTEKLNIKDTLQAFENGYIQLDNAITPTTSLEYSTNLPSVLSGVVEIQDKILDRVNILEKKKSITWDELEGV